MQQTATKKRPTVYISGPLSNGGKATPDERMQNVNAAVDVFVQLVHAGFAPFCPHLTEFVERISGRQFPHEVWMEIDRPLVPKFDALYRMPGESTGADIEVEVALYEGLVIARDIESLRQFFFCPLYANDAVILQHPASKQQPQDDLHRFETGAVRSTDADKTRYDLVSPIGLRRLAETCHEGAAKYSDFNWEKGMDIPNLLNHALRHLYIFLSGDRSEDHLAHAAWNLFAAMHSEEQWPDLNAGRLRTEGCRPPVHRVAEASSL